MKKKQLMGFATALSFAAGGLIPSSVVLAHDEDEPPPPGNISVLADEIMVGGFNIGLEPVATGLTAPNLGTANGIHSGRLYVTDQIGILWNIDLTGGAVECDASVPGSSDCTVFLDVRGLLVDLGIIGPGSFDERGLLGVAFHTDYANNGLLYT